MNRSIMLALVSSLALSVTGCVDPQTGDGSDDPSTSEASEDSTVYTVEYSAPDEKYGPLPANYLTTFVWYGCDWTNPQTGQYQIFANTTYPVVQRSAAAVVQQLINQRSDYPYAFPECWEPISAAHPKSFGFSQALCASWIPMSECF